MLTHRLPLLRLPAAMIVGALLLSGCGPLSNDGNDSSASAPQTNVSTVKETTAPQTDTSVSQQNSTSQATNTTKAPVVQGEYNVHDHANLTSREEYEPLVSKMVDCVEGYATIDVISKAIQLDTNCTYVEVDGAGTVLLAEDISNLKILGTNLSVFARNIDELTVSGDGNRVFWTGDTPTITDTGINNELLPAR